MAQDHQDQDDEQFFGERGFGVALGLGAHPCLVVVDLQVGFTSTDVPMGYDLTAEIGRTNRLIDAARAAGWPVMFTLISYADDAVLSRNIWAEKMRGLRTLRSGTSLVELDPRLHREPSDDVITKHYASAFFGTDIVSRLNTARADSIVVTGCTTSGCVRSTVVDAVQYGYRPVVVADAVGDRSRASHDQSLFDMRQKYADVMTADELVALITPKGPTGVPAAAHRTVAV